MNKIAPNLWYSTGEQYPYCRILYFDLFGWWIGVGLRWRVCASCNRKHPDYHFGSEGIKYVRFGYVCISDKYIPTSTRSKP